jgi:Phytanoyl-CoA dioxygenase (PhyH)
MKPSIDRRTKRRADVRPIGAEEFTEEMAPAMCELHGDLAAGAQRCLGLPCLTIDMGDTSFTIDSGSVSAGTRDASLSVRLDPATLGDLIAGLRSTFSLVFVGGAEFPLGGHREFLAWEYVLRALVDGTPLYEPGSLLLQDREGRALDLEQFFTPDDDDADVAHFVAEAGFCRLRRWVDPTVLGLIAEEVSIAVAGSEPGDADRWWADTEEGAKRCVRLRHLLKESPTMANVVQQDAYTRLGRLFRDGHRRFPDDPDSSEAIIKPLGVVSGLSEFPWHRDCSMGGHSYDCAAYAVGLPLSETGGEAGFLRAIAGSHRVSVPPPGLADGYDDGLPRVALATEPGDLTVHLGCTLHGTRRPFSNERIVTYTTFGLPRPEEAERLHTASDPDLDRVAQTSVT